MIPRCCGVDSAEDEIEPITDDRAGLHIYEVIAGAMPALRRQKAEDAGSQRVLASFRQTSSKYRDSEGAAVVKHPLSGGDRAMTTKVVP